MEDMLINISESSENCVYPFQTKIFFSSKMEIGKQNYKCDHFCFICKKPTKLYFSLHGSKKTKVAGELYQKSAWHCKRGNRWTAQVITIKGKTKTRKPRHCSTPEVGMMFNMMFLFSRLFGIDRDLMPPLIKSIERRHSLSLHSAEEIL